MMTGRKTKRKGKTGIRFNENMNKLGKTNLFTGILNLRKANSPSGLRAHVSFNLLSIQKEFGVFVRDGPNENSVSNV